MSRCLTVVIIDLALSSSIATLARAMLPWHRTLRFAAQMQRRTKGRYHRACRSARQRGISAVREEVGSEPADAVTLLLFALADPITPRQRDGLGTLNGLRP